MDRTTEPAGLPYRIFCAYSQKDAKLAGQLVKFLSEWERSGELIVSCLDRVGFPPDLTQALEDEIDRADVVVFLSSVDLWGEERWRALLQRALARRTQGARIEVVAMRRAALPAELESIQCLPKYQRPIAEWRFPERGLEEVAKTLRPAGASEQAPNVSAPLPANAGITWLNHLARPARWASLVLLCLAGVVWGWRLLSGASLPVARGIPEILVVGRSTDHPITMRDLCRALAQSAEGRVTCTLSFLDRPAPQGATVLNVDLGRNSIVLLPTHALAVQLGQLPLPEHGPEVDGLARLLIELARHVRGDATDPVQAATLNNPLVKQERSEMTILRLYVRALRGGPELSVKERNDLAQLSQRCLPESSTTWWCRAAMLMYVRNCAIEACDDVPTIVAALLQTPSLDQVEQWRARTALARHQCFQQAELAARAVIGLQEEMRAKDEGCMELSLVDALGCALYSLQTPSKPTEALKSLFSRLQLLERLAIGMMSCAGSTLQGALAQRAGWRAARGECQQALEDIAELRRKRIGLRIDDRDRLVEAKCHLVLGHSQFVVELLQRWLTDAKNQEVAGGQATKVRAAFYLWLADSGPVNSPSKQERARELLALFAQMKDGPALADMDQPFEDWLCRTPKTEGCAVFRVLANAKSSEVANQASLQKTLRIQG